MICELFEMAGCSNDRRDLTQSKLEAEAQIIMDNGLDSDSEFSDQASEHSDHQTDTEEEWDDEGEGIMHNDSSESSTESSGEENNISDFRNAFYGKNRFKWAKTPPAASRTRKHNLISHLPGIVGEARARMPLKPLHAWKCLISDDIIQEILAKTNERITNMASKYNLHNLSCQYTNHLDIIEFQAFLGLLYLAGVFKSNNEDLRSLFATNGTGRDIFRATMSLNRFYFLLSSLCFDEPATRLERIADGDNLAAISNVFNMFITNCQSNYSCGEYMTIDEMLIAFRGRCKFRMYLKSKPDKYGLKMQCLVDAKTHYLLNGFIYSGKDTHKTNPRKLSVPTLDVLALIPPISGTNRNVTGDNWFSSIELIRELKRHNITYVGTLKKNKREIPSEFQPHKDRLANSALFGFTASESLVSFVPKKNRAVLLVSTMHHSDTMVNEKPEVINFYNETKGGVDSLDKKCACYKTGRRTRRWPQVIWFRILDIAGVNANVIFNGVQGNKIMERRLFLTTLGQELIEDHVKRRAQQQCLPRELRIIIFKVSGLQEPVPPHNPEQLQGKKRGRCKICPYSKNQKKESSTCDKCRGFICKNHSHKKVLCENCIEK